MAVIWINKKYENRQVNPDYVLPTENEINQIAKTDQEQAAQLFQQQKDLTEKLRGAKIEW